jgi:hypothetical protein
MTRHREELDDTIDRVAAAITFVPADPALARRIAARIDHTSDVLAWRGLLAGAVDVAAVAIVVALVTSARQASIETPLVTTAPAERAPVLANAAPAVTPTVAPTESHAEVVRPQQAVRPEPRRIAEAAVDAPQIPALPLPALLDMTDLPTDALTIAPVDLTPLDLANLTVAELDDRNEPKE